MLNKFTIRILDLSGNQKIGQNKKNWENLFENLIFSKYSTIEELKLRDCYLSDAEIELFIKKLNEWTSKVKYKGD